MAKTKKFEVPEPRTAQQAADCMWHGFLWFFVHKRASTTTVLLTLFLLIAFSGRTVFEYFTTDRVTIEDARPIAGPPHGSMDIVPKAYAGGEPIVIGGQTYGYIDPAFQSWKLAGENALLVHHKPTGIVKRVVFEFNPEQFKSRK